MNKIKECFNEVKVVIGVGSGFITREEVEILTVKYDLSVEEKEALLTLLDEHSIRPIEERETDQKDEKAAVQEEEKCREAAIKVREIRVAELDMEYQSRVEQVPELDLWCELEKLELVKAIKKRAQYENDTAMEIIGGAVMDVSYLRAIKQWKTKGEDVGENISECAPYYNRRKETYIRRILYYFFTEEEMSELVYFCETGMSKKRSVTYWNKVLKFLLFKSPAITVSTRRRRDYLD